MRAVPVLLVCLALVTGCGGEDDASSDAPAPPVTECLEVEAPEPREPGTSDAPAGALSEPHELVFDTSCGSFTVALDLQSAPDTAASLVALADSGYFDDTIFHRVVPGFVIQGGDPTQSGAGGPGYSTLDRPPANARYTKGVVAMAKSQLEPPGTAGSQFFVVTDDAAADVLTPDYAIVGEVVDGIETVERIEALGVGDGPPSRPVVLESVTANRTG